MPGKILEKLFIEILEVASASNFHEKLEFLVNIRDYFQSIKSQRIQPSIGVIKTQLQNDR